MLASSNSARRVVHHFVRALSSTSCKQRLKVVNPENGGKTRTAPDFERIRADRFTSPDTASRTTEVFPKTWPVWDANNKRVTFLNVDCSTIETTTPLGMFELKVKCDVEQMGPECVYLQQVNRDIYTTRLIPLMSKLGYNSFSFLGDSVGQAAFYKNTPTTNI
ncbi:uncharacterized protein LOC110456886 [Mizuhopecten yessoensis]|uniref:Uncharacterized protein n=1 Tax=Mizuhopecten yessoensis TaxID=6573 RepID=A0A210Q9Y5_MIZYE|nr:uncharacterized protein LOC110456886 [Mizuhopecten yessoensis]OWF45552.1 hypothetical protein KP79_PYT07071 [Mizuhopecten yessoensis]